MLASLSEKPIEARNIYLNVYFVIPLSVYVCSADTSYDSPVLRIRDTTAILVLHGFKQAEKLHMLQDLPPLRMLL